MAKVSPDVQPRMQSKGTNCWLTCLEMMFGWKNKKQDGSYETQILEKMDGSSWLRPYYMRDAGIAPGECRETAKMLGLFACGDTATIGAAALADLIERHGPVWIAGRWYMECDHVIVVTGCDAATSKIKYINPWKNYSLEDSDGTIDWLQKRGDAWTNCDASVMYWMT